MLPQEVVLFPTADVQEIKAAAAKNGIYDWRVYVKDAVFAALDRPPEKSVPNPLTNFSPSGLQIAKALEAAPMTIKALVKALNILQVTCTASVSRLCQQGYVEPVGQAPTKGRSATIFALTPLGREHLFNATQGKTIRRDRERRQTLARFQMQRDRFLLLSQEQFDIEEGHEIDQARQRAAANRAQRERDAKVFRPQLLAMLGWIQAGKCLPEEWAAQKMEIADADFREARMSFEAQVTAALAPTLSAMGRDPEDFPGDHLNYELLEDLHRGDVAQKEMMAEYLAEKAAAREKADEDLRAKADTLADSMPHG